MVQLQAQCTVRMTSECEGTKTIEVSDEGYAAYQAGEFVQNAFPEMSANDREFFFISNTCGPCFDAIFDDAGD